MGKLITLYGVNNMGKTTHAKRLVANLNEMGHRAVHIKYPVYKIEPTGPLINKIVRGQTQKIDEDELQMWFVLNRYQYQPELKQMLDKGMIVVAEDYIGTGIAWGVTKGLPQSWLEDLNKFLIQSDFSIFIDGERSLKSKEKDHVHEQNDELVDKSKEVHRKLAKEYGWRRIELQAEKKDTEKLILDAVDEFLRKGV